MPRALVTGAAGAIGATTARHLVERGWDLELFDRYEILHDFGESESQTVNRHVVDLTDHDHTREVIAGLPQLDALAGIAGVVETAMFLDQDVESWQRVFDANVIANLVVTQAVAKRWVEERTGGAVVLVSSWAGTRPWPEITAYASSKAALEQMARSAALELAPYGIRVNSVAPGILGEGMAGDYAERDPEYARRARAAVPLGELQTSLSVAHAIAFLLEPTGSYATGSTLFVDGGASLVSGAGVLTE